MTADAVDSLPSLRVAAVQAVSVAGDVEANVAVGGRRGCAAPPTEGAALVVLPELFLPGYDPGTLRARPDACDVTPDDPRLDPLRLAAAETGAGSSSAPRSGSRPGCRTVSLLAFDAAGGLSRSGTRSSISGTRSGPIFDGRRRRRRRVRLDGWSLGLGHLLRRLLPRARTGCLRCRCARVRLPVGLRRRQRAPPRPVLRGAGPRQRHLRRLRGPGRLVRRPGVQWRYGDLRPAGPTGRPRGHRRGPRGRRPRPGGDRRGPPHQPLRPRPPRLPRLPHLDPPHPRR